MNLNTMCFYDHKKAGEVEAIGRAYVKDGTRCLYRVVYWDHHWGKPFVLINKEAWPFYEYSHGFYHRDPDGTMYGHI